MKFSDIKEKTDVKAKVLKEIYGLHFPECNHGNKKTVMNKNIFSSPNAFVQFSLNPYSTSLSLKIMFFKTM